MQRKRLKIKKSHPGNSPNSVNVQSLIDSDPLLQLMGSGKDLWADEHADEYVRRIREGWDEAAELRENREKPPLHPPDGPPK